MLSLSIVVPVYSGAGYLRDLVGEIGKLRVQLTAKDAPFQVSEIIFVDDAAIDESSELLDDLAAEYPWVTVLHLSRNFGQHPATIAGILHTSGDWVVTMDEDLQHPPSRIPDLLAIAIQKGADIVYGNPESKVHQSVFRDFSSHNYKRLIERLTGNSEIRKANSFRLIRGPVARGTSSVCGHDTYFDVALGWFSQRIETVSMPLHDGRFNHSGKSGYSLKSLLSHARRLAFSSQIKLLRAGTLLGFIMLILSFLAAFVLFLVWLFASNWIGAPGWTSLMLAICFSAGISMMLTGLVLEYISILVLRAHGKPMFFTIDRSQDQALKSYFAKSD